jgi:hypothetical protein
METLMADATKKIIMISGWDSLRERTHGERTHDATAVNILTASDPVTRAVGD